jgi:hypothetical protein
MTRYRVTGTQPVVIDGTTHAPGAVLETAADVTFLLAIGALTPEGAADQVDGLAPTDEEV